MKNNWFTEDDLDGCWPHCKTYLLEILNREYDLNDAREDLRSLIGSKFDARQDKPVPANTEGLVAKVINRGD